MTFNQLLNPCLINESLLCLLGVQPVADSILKQKYGIKSLKNSPALESESTDTQLNYYSLLKDFLIELFSGVKVVEDYLDLFKPKVLDNLVKQGISEAMFKKQKILITSTSKESDNKDSNFREIPLSIQSVETIEQIYIFCCLLLVTSIRSKNQAWAITNLNYLSNNYKKVLKPFNICSGVKETDSLSISSVHTNEDGGNVQELKITIDYQNEQLKELEIQKLRLENELNKLKYEQDELKDELNNRIIIIDKLRKLKHQNVLKIDKNGDELCNFELKLIEGVVKLLVEEVCGKSGSDYLQGEVSGSHGIGS